MCVRLCRESLTSQNVLEGQFDVTCVKGGSLNEGQIVLAYVCQHDPKASTVMTYSQTASLLPLVRPANVADHSCFPPT